MRICILKEIFLISKSIDYYIVPDSFSIEQKKNAKPVVSVAGKLDVFNTNPYSAKYGI